MEQLRAMEQLSYTNPRLKATFENWPTGKFRTTAIFEIETHPKRGQRATRVTLDPFSHNPRKPKADTYAFKVRIVDGSNGRTYIVKDVGYAFDIMRSDLKFQQEYISRDVDPQRYAEVRRLFEEEGGDNGQG